MVGLKFQLLVDDVSVSRVGLILQLM